MRGHYYVISLLIMASCQTSPEPILDIGLDYFPLKVGTFQIYSVDETQITQSAEQRFVYELRVEVIDSSLNQEGGYTYILKRQKRTDANLPWIDLDTWTARIDSRTAIIAEGNTSFVKLAFPIQEKLSWDGNAYNTLGGEQYCGENKDQPCDVYQLENIANEFTVAGMTFPETVKINQNENKDLIVKQDVRSEIYAKTIGLIYKESVVLEYCTKSSCLGQQKVDKGLRYKQALKEYGTK